MTSVRIVLLVHKLWSADSAGWSGHVLRDWRSAVHIIMWPTSSSVMDISTRWAGTVLGRAPPIYTRTVPAHLHQHIIVETASEQYIVYCTSGHVFSRFWYCCKLPCKRLSATYNSSYWCTDSEVHQISTRRQATGCRGWLQNQLGSHKIEFTQNHSLLHITSSYNNNLIVTY